MTTSWDDGAKEDLKLADLLLKYDVPATFYLPLRNPERKVMNTREIKEIGERFEIGGHTANHKILTDISLKNAKKEISEGKKKLEEIIGWPIISFCYPKGMYNRDIKQFVGFSGYEYARTTELFSTQVQDKLLAGTTVHAYDHHPLVYIRELGLRLRSGSESRLGKLGMLGMISKKWDELALYWLDYCRKNGGTYHFWGHSWEIEEAGDWDKLKRVLSYISQHTVKGERKTNGDLLSELEKGKKRYYEKQDPAKYKSNVKVIAALTREFDRKGKRILDVGCGNGQVSELFSNADYTGIDFAGNFIRYAKKRYPERKFYLSDYKEIQKLGLPKQDLIIVWGMFEDAADPFGKLDLVKPLIKKGTKIIFSLHNSQSLVFRFFKFLQTRFYKEFFPYTSFTRSFLQREFNVKVMDSGSTLIVILNK